MILWALFVVALIVSPLLFGELVGRSVYALGVVAMFCSVAYAWLKGRVENKQKRIALAIVLGVLASAVLVGLILLFFYIIAFRK